MEDQQVWPPDGQVGHLGGYGFSIGRARLLEILDERAAALGVDLRHEHEAGDPSAIEADLVVAAEVPTAWYENVVRPISARVSR